MITLLVLENTMTEQMIAPAGSRIEVWMRSNTYNGLEEVEEEKEEEGPLLTSKLVYNKKHMICK